MAGENEVFDKFSRSISAFALQLLCYALAEFREVICIDDFPL